MRMIASTALAAALLYTAATGHAESGREVFAKLASLVGTWEGYTKDGRRQTVAFRYSAAGSVLVETWTLGQGRESMTLYTLDGERLLATHYCPQGNQPRLVFSPGGRATARWRFRFLDGTNLHVAGRSHQQAFWLALDGTDAFERGETYVDNDAAITQPEPDGEAVRYRRMTR